VCGVRVEGLGFWVVPPSGAIARLTIASVSTCKRARCSVRGREGERGRGRGRASVRKRDRACVCERECAIESERVSVCVCERECVCVRERASESLSVCV